MEGKPYVDLSSFVLCLVCTFIFGLEMMGDLI